MSGAIENYDEWIPQMTLAEALGAYYKAKVISHEASADATLAAALEDQDLRTQAVAEMKRLTDLGARGNLAQRCFISHVHLEGLRKALA